MRKDDCFFLVQECLYEQAWHLPAGRAEPGETFVAAALEVDLVVVEGSGHGGPGFASPENRKLTDEFFARHLKSGER